MKTLLEMAAEILREPDVIERRRLVLESTDLLGYLKEQNVADAELCTALIMQDSTDWMHVFVNDQYSTNVLFFLGYEIHIKPRGFHFEKLFDGKNDFYPMRLLDGLKTAKGLE